ncbi:MAG: threonine synthase [Chloroflexi bacterium]|nr:threonine synthase [Chloroflexota bacterium]
MGFATALRCRECGREYPKEPINICEWCFGPLEVVYDHDRMAAVVTRERIESGPPTMWRYRDLLPVGDGPVIDLHCGLTPLIKADNLGRELGLQNLYLKNDCVNPTYSFKDRVVTVAATVAKEMGFDTLACASTGNLAGAVAAHAAKAGMQAYVFMPADLERVKIVGAAVYGPTVIAVDGSYDEVNRLCSEVADSFGWAFVNINIRPYYAEGSKTLGYEVAEQLGWRAPDHAVVPVASGSLYVKIWKGLNEFRDLGLIDQVQTKMHMAQPLGCSPVVTAYAAGVMDVRPVKPNTIAKSLAIGNPADGYYALKVIKESEGSATAVSDDEVIEGIKLLAQTEGIFAETAAGVVVSALRRLAHSGAIGPKELTVAYVTGNGLKTQEVVEEDARPLLVKPTLDSFKEALERRG